MLEMKTHLFIHNNGTNTDISILKLVYIHNKFIHAWANCVVISRDIPLPILKL